MTTSSNKAVYEQPRVCVIVYSVKDVITASLTDYQDAAPFQKGWLES